MVLAALFTERKAEGEKFTRAKAMIVIDCVVCSVFEREQGDLLSLFFYLE